MIPVSEARASLLSLVARLPSEPVPLRAAAGRVLAAPVAARHDQPAFAASAMDGYAVSGAPKAGDRLRVVGESAAGHPFAGTVGPGEAARIFTGAPVPSGANRVILQEDVVRDGGKITITETSKATHIRPVAGDFAAGTPFDRNAPLGSRDIALLAAMGHGSLSVTRRPLVAILMTGDELRPPGASLGPGQITASNGYGLAAMFEAAGAETRLLPTARDTPGSLGTALDLASDADLLVTIGGASVGDHDLVAGALNAAGCEMAFHKVAMRPGKPLMAGRLGATAVIGLPGNPVSSMVCAVIFILPMLRRMVGLPEQTEIVQRALAAPVQANGPREHYMRATLTEAGVSRIASRQDSSLLTVLANADHLVIRPPHDPARAAGEWVDTIPLPA